MGRPLARKYRMPHGAQRRIAQKRRVSESFVSQVVNGHATPRTPRGMRKYEAVRVDVAALFGVSVEEAFADEDPEATVEAAARQHAVA